MSGRGRKPQSTSSNKNNTSGTTRNTTSSKNKNASKNTKAASASTTTTTSAATSSTATASLGNRSQSDNEDLRKQLIELKAKFEELSQENNLIKFENKKLSDQNDILRNEEFLKDFSKDADSQVEAESDDIRPAKRRKLTDEEEKRKILLKVFMKTYPPELNLKYDETFRSDANVKICQKLIPAIQKDVKLFYDLNSSQVESLLQTFHRTGRSKYTKSNPSVDNAPDDSHLQVEAESDGATRSAKRQTKLKGKKLANNLSEEEEGLKIEDKAKNLMKVFMKGYPSELELKYDETFKSDANVKICHKLIPALQKDIKTWYNLSNNQVENWLQGFHKNKRKAFMKSD